MQYGLVSRGWMNTGFVHGHKGRKERAVYSRFFVEQMNSWVSAYNIALDYFFVLCALDRNIMHKRNPQTIFYFLFFRFLVLPPKRFPSKWSLCDVLKPGTQHPITEIPYGTSAGHNMELISCCLYWKHWKQCDGTIQDILPTVLLFIIGNPSNLFCLC